MQINFEKYSDEELMNKYLSMKDIRYFSALFIRYNHLIFGVCMKYLKHTEDCRDMVMELYEKVLEDLQKHAVDNFRSWIYVTARNQCLMKIRKQKRHGITQDEYILSNVVDSAADWHPDSSEPNELMIKYLELCIEKLTDDQRECVEQFYFKKNSYAEISTAFELDIKTVKSYIQNGKRNLKNCIDQKIVKTG